MCLLPLGVDSEKTRILVGKKNLSIFALPARKGTLSQSATIGLFWPTGCAVALDPLTHWGKSPRFTPGFLTHWGKNPRFMASRVATVVSGV